MRRKVSYHRLILNLAKSHQCGSLVLIGRHYYLGYCIQLVTVTGAGPMIDSVRGIVIIVLEGIILSIKQILGIEEHYSHALLRA